MLQTSFFLKYAHISYKAIAIAIYTMFFICAQSWGQTSKIANYQIIGYIYDDVTHEPEMAATIIVTAKQNSKEIIKKAVTDINGKFDFSVSHTGDYVLNAFVLGKKTTTLNFKVLPSDTIVSLGEIYLSTDVKLLKGIEVVAQKPLVKMDVDKLTYDVASDPDAQAMTTSEILSKVPLIDVDGNGNIRMNGTTNFLILQNGRRTAITRHPKDILRSLPAQLIKSIEVISSPGAKYDAEGIGGIINIVMQRRYEGHLSNVNGTLNNMGFNTGVSTTTKINKFSIDGYISYNRIFTPTGGNNNQTYNYVSESKAHQASYNREKSRGSTEFANINASYEIDSLQLLTLSLSGMGSQQRSPSWGSTEMWGINNRFAYSYLRQNTSKQSFINGTAGLDYQRIGKRNKQNVSTFSYQISTNPQWTKGTTQYYDIVNNLNENIVDELQLYNNHTHYNNQCLEHTLQIDNVSPLDKHQTIETGIKYILRNNESISDIYDSHDKDDEYLYNTQRSNHYKNRNDIFAAYLSYTYRGSKISVMPGARYEYTYQNIQYLSGILGSDANYTGHYAYLVPSLKINFKIARSQSLRLDYGMRLSRPSIYYLNPYFNNVNAQHIFQGNGNLEAECSHSFGITYGNFTRKLNINLSLTYRMLNNGIEQVSRIIKDGGEYFDNGKHYASPGSVYSTYINIGHTKHSSFDFYIRWNMLRQLSWTFNGNIAYLDIEDPLRQQRNHGWKAFLSSNVSIQLPAALRFMGRIAYSSRDIMLQGENSSLVTYNFSLNRSFLKNNRLTITLNASDIFRSWMTRSRTTYDSNFYTQSTQQVKRQYYGITVMYRLGNLRQSDTKKVRHGIKNDDLKAAVHR